MASNIVPAAIVPTARSRRRFLRTAAALGLGLGTPPALRAQLQPISTFPNGRIQIVVPARQGDRLDALARLAARLAAPRLGGATITIENRPGAQQQHGAHAVAQTAQFDGHLLALSVPAWLRESLMRETAYDPMADFSYIVPLAACAPCIAVSADSPYRHIAEVIEDAHRHPGRISYCMRGIGSLAHLLMEDAAHRQGVRLNAIAMRRDADILRSVVTGHIDLMAVGSTWPLQAAGPVVRPLLTFAPQRLPAYPDMPTAAELGLDIAQLSPIGLAGPAQMDREARRLLYEAFSAASREPTYTDLVANAGLLGLQLDITGLTHLMRDGYQARHAIMQRLGLLHAL